MIPSVSAESGDLPSQKKAEGISQIRIRPNFMSLQIPSARLPKNRAAEDKADRHLEKCLTLFCVFLTKLARYSQQDPISAMIRNVI